MNVTKKFAICVSIFFISNVICYMFETESNLIKNKIERSSKLSIENLFFSNNYCDFYKLFIRHLFVVALFRNDIYHKWWHQNQNLLFSKYETKTTIFFDVMTQNFWIICLLKHIIYQFKSENTNFCVFVIDVQNNIFV